MTCQFFIKIGIVQYCQLNKEFIATTLCINKDKPELECDGRCYLEDQLNKQDEQEEKLPSQLNEKYEISFLVTNDALGLVIIGKLPELEQFLPYLTPTHSDPLFGIFHPPKTV